MKTVEHTMKRGLGVLVMVSAFCVTMVGCSDDDYSDPSSSALCGEGDEVNSGDEAFCVYTAELIIEGFECPMDLPVRHDYDTFVLCAPGQDLPPGIDDDLRADGYTPDPPMVDDGECIEGSTAQQDCNTCTCMDGGWACTTIGCDVNNTTPGNALSVSLSCPGTSGDPFDLTEPAISGDLLAFTAGYGGGCEEHEFIVCWDGTFLESNPVQANLGIVHLGNDDNCEAYITEALTVDLTTLKASYQEGYQTETGTIIIGLGDDRPSVEYNF